MKCIFYSLVENISIRLFLYSKTGENKKESR
nr:MAG TPA: hypothetical protein [Caudoviricetes sp.]